VPRRAWLSGRENGSLQPLIDRREISLLARNYSSVALQEFGYSVAYASGKFVVGARELGDDKIGAAFLYSL
jgi:hypothetical protein